MHRPQFEHPVVPSTSAAGFTTSTCKRPSSRRLPIKQGILSLSIIIAVTSLLLFAGSLAATLRKAPAAAPLLPVTALQQFSVNLPVKQLLVCLPGCLAALILSAAFSTATVLAPSWYHQGGREQLLAAARLLPRAVTLLQLLLLPTTSLEQLHSMWLHTIVIGAKGLPAVIIWPLLFPTTVRSYLQLAPVECALYMAVSCMFSFRTSTPPAFPPLHELATLALLYAACGLMLPVALLTFNKHLQLSRRQLTTTKVAASPPEAARSQKESTPQPTPVASLDPALKLPQAILSPEAARPASPPPQSPCKASDTITATLRHLAAASVAVKSGTGSSIMGPPPSSKMALYRSRSTVKVIGVKIHDHRAYARREAIVASLTANLQASPANLTTLLLTSCAVEGCLQLILTASTLDGSVPFLPRDASDIVAPFVHLYFQLPIGCRKGLVTLHMNDTLASFEGGLAAEKLQPQLLPLSDIDSEDAGGGIGALKWAPICFEAGSWGGTEVVVTFGLEAGEGRGHAFEAEAATAGEGAKDAVGCLEGTQAGVVVAGVEAVVQCKRGGEALVVKLPVLVVTGRPGSGRLLLPPGLDTGPLAIYLLSTQEGREGVLLASLVTMALPAPTAAEMQHAYSLQDDDGTVTPAEFQRAMRELLRDYVLCWKLCKGILCPVTHHQSSQVLKPELGLLLSDVLQHLADHSLPACHALLFYHSSTSSPSSSAASSSNASPSVVSQEAAIASTSTLSTAGAAASSPEQPPPPAGSRLQYLARRCARLVAVSRDPRYSAWRQQQSSHVDRTGWLIITMMCAMGIWVGGKRLLADLGFGLPWAGWLLTFLVLHLGPGLGPQLLLACGGERLRGRREAVLVAFALLRASTFVVEVVGWLPTPDPLKLLWGVAPTSLVMHGILRPCLQQQVSWKVQLLVSSIEEAAKYSALTAAPCTGDPKTLSACKPSRQYARISLGVVGMAVAVSCLMEGLYVLAYASVLDSATAARKQLPPAEGEEEEEVETGGCSS